MPSLNDLLKKQIKHSDEHKQVVSNLLKSSLQATQPKEIKK